MSEGRKVAAILVADIVGYSRLTGADEERTLARLRTLRSDLIDPTIAVHNGRLVKRTGDGAVVEFRSVVEAVRSAIEVQSGLAERNAGLPADQRIEVRVGIHLGDVVEEADGDLMGDGVNVAARLEGICEPGGVCLSSAAYEQVRDKLHEPFVDLGEQTLKNIARPARVYALRPRAGASAPPAPAIKPRAKALLWPVIAAAFIVVLVAVGWFGRHALAPAPPPAPAAVAAAADDKLAHAPRLSIVVLPFANLSGDPEQDYFADGLTEDLTTDLTHLPDSFVIGRSTAAEYKGKPVDLKQLGHDLGVRYALEGSVRRVGETITVNAQLIATETGAHLWAERFDGERGKLGALQVEAVARIANALGAQLVNAEALRALRERPANPDATDLAMRGTATMNQSLALASLDKAIEYFDQALRLDPDEPRALLGKANAQMLKVSMFLSGDWWEVYPNAERAADRVLASQPNSDWAHLIKAVVAESRAQLGAALAEVDAAIQADRNFAPAYAEKSSILTLSGHAAEAFAPLEQALRLDPLNPARHIWEWYGCRAHNLLAQWDQAVDWCEKSIASGPSIAVAYEHLASAYAWLGRAAEASDALVRLQALRPDFTVQHFLSGVIVSSDPIYRAGIERIAEGLRKAGLPENTPPAAAADKGSKWCSGVKIAANFSGWAPGTPDQFTAIAVNGVRQAELDLGPTVTYAYGHNDPKRIMDLLQQAIDARVDGVAFMGRGVEADALIDKAFAEGVIVATNYVAQPDAEKRHAAEGQAFAGVSGYASGFALASEAAKRAGLKRGDAAFAWGRKARPGELGELAKGIVEALEQAGVRVVYEELDLAIDHGGGDPAATFAAVMKANPDIKLVVSDDTGPTWNFGFFAHAAGLKPGQVFMAGMTLTAKAAEAIKDGYLSLVLDDQPYLQGYLPVLNICLTKKFGFSGLHFATAAPFIDAHNVDALAPLIEKAIR